jgi:hypothetical protein
MHGGKSEYPENTLGVYLLYGILFFSGNMSNPNYSKPAYEDPNKMYEMPAVPGNQGGKMVAYAWHTNRNNCTINKDDSSYFRQN